LQWDCHENKVLENKVKFCLSSQEIFSGRKSQGNPKGCAPDNGKVNQIMEDGFASNACGKQKDPLKSAHKSISSEKNSSKEDSVDITALIRSLQRSEGNPDCFRRTGEYCDQIDCEWRPYCITDFPTHG